MTETSTSTTPDQIDINRSAIPGKGVPRIFESAAGGIAAVGGVATGAYAAGYAYQWAYLAHFRAEWLVGELNAAEVLFNSGVILTILGLFIGVAIAGVIDTTPDVGPLLRHATWAFVGASVLVVSDIALQYSISLTGRVVLNASALLLAALAAIEVAKIGATQVKDAGELTRRDTLMASTIAVFLIFALIPGLFGKTHALYKRSNVKALMPIAVVRVDGKVLTLPLLFAGPNRAYCLTGQDYRTVVPIPWEAVGTVRGRRERG